MCLRQLVVSPALIREYSRHMRRHVPTLGACRGLGSRRLPARLKDVCAEIDPISALLANATNANSVKTAEEDS